MGKEFLKRTDICLCITEAFRGGGGGKETACQCRRHKRCGFDPWVEKRLWRRKWQLTIVFLLGESHGQRSLAACSPWGCKELERLSTAQVCHSFPSKEQMSLNFMDVATVHSDFRAQENKICHCFYFFPFCLL